MAGGLTRIGFQRTELEGMEEAALEGLEPSSDEFPESFDSAGRRYIEAMFSQQANESFEEARSMFERADAAAPQEAESQIPDLAFRGTEEIQLTNTVVADYTQKYRGIPIYGSRIGVEMTDSKELVSINGYVAQPSDIDPVASISPKEAQEIVKGIAAVGQNRPLVGGSAPELVLRYDDTESRWRLTYRFDSVFLPDAAREAREDYEEPDGRRDQLYEIFIDAHNGEEVARIPLQMHLLPVLGSGEDADGTLHEFSVTSLDNGTFLLEDPVRRIRTLSMNFNDINCGPLQLPGNQVSSPSQVFSHPSAIVAHANASRVSDFINNFLMRNGIDGQGMWIVSAVDCLNYRRNNFFGCDPIDPAKEEYRNAQWRRVPHPSFPLAVQRGMMIYGQLRWPDGRLHSYAESLDVVAHELTHGIINYTANLEYRTESGALNESYADIFGVAVSNAGFSDIDDWNWQIGEEVRPTNVPIRDMSDPTLHGQPDHMNNFLRLAPGESPSNSNDWGFVHANSGIHNKAAHNLFTSGAFTWEEVVQMFFRTLAVPGILSQTATFSDAKAGMLASCAALFANEADLDVRVEAVRKAYEDVGI